MKDFEVMKWLLYKMQVGEVYDVNERQVNRIKKLWDIFHLQEDVYLVFNDDFTKIKKRKYDRENISQDEILEDNDLEILS